MACTEAREPAEFCLVARRNHSLSWAGRQLVLASLFVVSLAISLAFATLGAWLVLPFSGLELGVVYWAFRCMERRATDYESITIVGDRLVIERQDQGHTSRFECNKHWAQVRWSPNGSGQRASLVIRSQGKEMEFGQHLPDYKVREIAAQIRQQISLYRNE